LNIHVVSYTCGFTLRAKTHILRSFFEHEPLKPVVFAQATWESLGCLGHGAIMGRANQLGCREVEMYSAILKPFC
jgi:hypothetical protein